MCFTRTHCVCMLLKHVHLNCYAVHNKPTGRHNEQRFAKIRITNIHQNSLCSECQRKELNHHTIITATAKLLRITSKILGLISFSFSLTLYYSMIYPNLIYTKIVSLNKSLSKKENKTQYVSQTLTTQLSPRVFLLRKLNILSVYRTNTIHVFVYSYMLSLSLSFLLYHHL